MSRFFSASPIGANFAIGITRIVTGVFLIYHGWEIFDSEAMSQYLGWDVFKSSSGKTLIYGGKAAELVAGILLVLGLFTRIACILTIGTLGYIAFFVGDGKVWAGAQHPFFFVLLGFLFFFTGPGAFSADSLFTKKRS